jgi:chloramphenicol 3-O phosphotransferase
MSALVVIIGGSSAGKSSLARALQEELLPAQWLHFSLDSILSCLPQSILGRANLQNDWSEIDTDAIAGAAHGCLHALLDQGHHVLFDCVVMSDRRALQMFLTLERHRPALVRLTCDWEETERRTIARGDRTIAEARRGFEISGMGLSADYSFDTTLSSPAQIARELTPLLATRQSHGAWLANISRLNAKRQTRAT